MCVAYGLCAGQAQLARTSLWLIDSCQPGQVRHPVAVTQTFARHGAQMNKIEQGMEGGTEPGVA